MVRKSGRRFVSARAILLHRPHGDPVEITLEPPRPGAPGRVAVGSGRGAAVDERGGPGAGHGRVLLTQDALGFDPALLLQQAGSIVGGP